MPALRLDLDQLRRDHTRFRQVLDAGRVNLYPVIVACARDMKQEIVRQIATEGDGTWPARSPNTLLTGKRALGGPAGSVATNTRAAAFDSTDGGKSYGVAVVGPPLSTWMEKGTVPHTITATNPSGRLAFAVVPTGGRARVAPGRRSALLGTARGYRHQASLVRKSAKGLLPEPHERLYAQAAGIQRRGNTPRALAHGGMLVRPQSVHHPGTPPRPFTQFTTAWWAAHLWNPIRRFRALAAGQAYSGDL